MKDTQKKNEELIEELKALRKRNLELEESEAKYRDLFENSLEGILISKGSRFISANRTFIESLGYETFEEIASKDIFKYIAPESTELISDLINKSDNKELSKLKLNIKVVRKDGDIRDIEMSIGEIIIGDDKYLQSTFRDISDWKRAQLALQESEEKYRGLIERANDGIAILQNAKIKFANPSLITMSGYDYDKFINTRFIDYIHPDDMTKVREYYKGRMEYYKEIKNGKRTPWLYEAKFIRKSGEIAFTEVSAGLITYQGEPADLVVIRDITERKKVEEENQKLEKQLFQSQKMESIGRLAGGIAHDFGNILTVIMGHADLLRLTLNDTSTREGKAVEKIFKNSIRSRALIKQLLSFARGGEYHPELLSANTVIKDTVEVSERIFDRKVKIIYNLSNDLHRIRADKNQLDQVLTNLIINAKDAMPEGGELTFKTENVRLDKHITKKNPNLNPGAFVRISVTDTGTGIPEDVKDRVFEPFFTTKEKGKGTGLGLSTTYGILRNHKGHIDLYSETDIGTTFNIYLPVAEEDIVKDGVKANIIKGAGTIMIVDDE
ncbi:MAG: PAS domain S-box protein, partial [bacterium]|nr:PAS domain S-box protein [bacterium]